MNDLMVLKKQGLSIRAIGALTGYDRKTVRKYVASGAPAPQYGPRVRRPSKLDAFKPYLEERLNAGVWNAVVLLRELRERGYEGGYSILKEYLQPQRSAAQQVAVRRFETAPGEQAQVDWGHLGSIRSGRRKEKLWGFVLTLGYSRAAMAAAATDQRLGTLLRMHEEAFRQLGGVPREILYDRMKTVWLSTDERGEIIWHPQFLDFARYWGFTPRLCRPYRAQTKGKVESGVKYVRRNFLPSLYGREPHSLEELNSALYAWVWGVANRRTHGTTHCVVKESWETERDCLQSIVGRPPYAYIEQEQRRASRDAFIAWRGNGFSVPWTYAGRDVAVREVHGGVEVWAGPERIAAHALPEGKHRTVAVAAHHAGIPLGAFRHGGKDQVHLQAAMPEVEIRPLCTYDWVLAGGAR